MPPQKRTLKDFFAPAPKGSQPSRSTAPKPPAPPNTIQRSLIGSANPPNTRHSSAAAEKNTGKPPTPSSYPTSIQTNTAPRSPDAENPPLATSQSSANSSGTSKRVFSNGEPVVLNSDSETDSLPDLDWGGPSNRFKTSTQHVKPKPKVGFEDGDLRRPPKKQRDGNSFSLFVQKAQKNAETERKIAEVKADLEKPLEELTPPPLDYGISEKALADVVHDDEDPEKAKRLYLAMQRTNALHTDCVFRLFGAKADVKASPFPMQSLPNHRWTSNFEAKLTRDQAFASGFAHQVFRYQQLPEELALWMIDEICLGRNDALDVKYLQLLKTHHHYLKKLLDPGRLDVIFNKLGARQQCLDPLQEVVPSLEPQSATKRRSLPASLKSVGSLLQTAAPWLRTKASSHALYLLYHICMDDSVIADIDALHVVQDAIEAIVCNIPYSRKLTSVVGQHSYTDGTFLIIHQLKDVVTLLLRRITHPILQKNLVSSLPTRSPVTASFQRYLALSFLLHPTPVEVALEDPSIPPLIHEHLQDSPDFRISKGTDHAPLAARLTLLDIAIGPGPFIVPYQPLTSPSPPQGGSSPVNPPGPLSSEERAFNKEVDALAQHVKLIGNSISEAGALTDLTRLEAKDCSERLYHRLEHAVRIGGKKLKNLFDDDDESEVEHGKRIFSKWLTSKSRSGTQTPDLNGAVSGAAQDDGRGGATEA